MSHRDPSSFPGEKRRGRRDHHLYRLSSPSTHLLLACLHLLSLTLSPITNSANASPMREYTICGPAKCNPERTKFHYKADTVYFYNYAVNTTTGIDNGPSQESGFHLSSQAAIKFLSPCEAVLTLNGVEVWESSRSEPEDEHKFKASSAKNTVGKALEAFPLRFSYLDGTIEEVCPDPADSVSAVNIKKGLLSALQNTMRRLDLQHKGEEDDVHGRCKTEYELGRATSSTLTLDRIKDINSCGDRFGISSSVKGVSYAFGTLHQSMPAVSSLSECSQSVDRNLIASVFCQERHRLKSLSRGAAGAVTSITQKLDMVAVFLPLITVNGTQVPDTAAEEVDGDRPTYKLASVATLNEGIRNKLESYPSKILQRDSLAYRYKYSTPGGSNSGSGDAESLANAKKSLGNFCKSVKGKVEENSGDLFDNLVDTFRLLSSSQLMSLSKESPGICGGERVPFDDALEATGTTASITVIKDKIRSKDAPPATISSWIASLTYIPNPDLALMEAAIHILRNRTEFPQVLLTCSSLAHTYCRSNPKCSQHHPIGILIKLYEKYFSATLCKAGSDSLNSMLMYLKGLGNFGIITPKINQALLACARNTGETEIRVAAIEAYRRAPCGYDTSFLKEMFTTETEDSEIRIQAFLALMKCPAYETVRFIQDALFKEEVNQVGSFVYSYVRNLQDTALPSKAELQALVADERLAKKFATDVRKFSRNFEISTFYDDYNLGAGVDTNVIYSENSYIPRSTSLNLTVDLFGESVNVLEAGIRLESFEHYIESIFAPKSKPPMEKKDFQTKRKLRSFSQAYDVQKSYYKDPVVSLSLRTFGNEINFDRKVGAQSQLDFVKGLSPLRSLKNLKKMDTNWQKSTMLLDSSYIIPTGAGFPLNLSAQASSIFRMEAMSMMDAENFRANSELKLSGKLEPSALFMVTGSMRLGFPDLESGIKVRAKIRTSVSVAAEFQLKGSELFKVEFGLPQSQVDLVEYSSELLIKQGSEYKVIGEIPATGKKPLCTAGYISSLLGIKMCTSSYFSLRPGGETDDSLSPYFPLNGPSQFKIALDKSNPQLVKTRFVYLWNKNEDQNSLRLSYESVSKKSSGLETTEVAGFNFDVNKVSRDFRVALMTPHYAINGSGQLEADKSKGSLDFYMSRKGSDSPTFHTTLSFVQSIGRGKTLLQPQAQVFYENEKIIHMQSELSVGESSTGTSFDGSGTFTWKQNEHALTIRGVRNDSSFTLSLESDSNGDTSRWGASGRLVDVEDQCLLDARLKVDFSKHPEYNIDSNYHFEANDEGWTSSSELKLSDGPTRTGGKGLKLQHELMFEKLHDSTKSRGLFVFVQPSRKIDWSLDLGLNTQGKSFNSALNLRYAPGKNLQTSLSLKRATGVLTFLQIGWNITLPDEYPLLMSLQLHEKSYRLYETTINIDWFQRNTIALIGNYNDKSKRNNINKYVLLSIQTQSTDPLKFSGHVVHQEDKETKIELAMEYGSRRNSLEIGHNNKGKRQLAYLTLHHGGDKYLITGNLERENGLALIIKTDFGSKLADIYFSSNATNHNGMQLYSINYKWDATSERVKQYIAECTMDLTREDIKRFDLLLTYASNHWLLKGEYLYDLDTGNRVAKGKLKLDDDTQLHASLHLNPTVRNSKRITLDGLQAVAKLDSTLPQIPSANFNLRVEQEDQERRKFDIDGSWGAKGKIAGSIVTTWEKLEGDGSEDENEDISSEDEDPNDKESQEGDVLSSGKKPSHSFKWTLRANFNSSINHWETFGFNMLHTQHLPTHFMTDIDIQLPEKKDLSLRAQIRIPRSRNEIWMSRGEVQVKTPFVGYQSLALRISVGHQEDSDVLALAGIYTDNMQYAITIKGTPRFEEDGSLGFEITSSHPGYDKIFGSFSYSMGDSHSLACQLGWPGVVVLLDSRAEWKDLTEFDVSLTFSSPWELLRSINLSSKLDSAEAEWMFKVNEKGVEGKCEWTIESYMNADIRLDMSSTFESMKDVGFILKKAIELPLNPGDDYNINSQIVGWVNEQRLGYKVESERSEVDEEDVIAKIMSAQLELDVLVYPTIRSTFRFEQRDEKFNLQLSLLLREGPINVSADLHLIDLFRFNEKIKITTPYSGLLELEIDLTPAIMPEEELYNLGLASKWRSGSQWSEGGLVLRYGDQAVLLKALEADKTSQVTDYEDDPGDEETQGANDPDEENKPETEKENAGIEIPFSQLLHFYSPISWAREIKLEFLKLSPQTPKQGGEDEEESGEEFPIRTLVLRYASDSSELSTTLQNDKLIKNGKIVIRIPLPNEQIHVELGGDVNLAEDEKVLNLFTTFLNNSLQTISLRTTWEREGSNYFNGKAALRSPWEDFEEHLLALMYAHNAVEQSYTLSAELEKPGSGKIDSTFVLEPRRFSAELSSPFHILRKLDWESSFEEEPEEGTKDILTTTIKALSHNQEIEVDVTSEIKSKWPTQVQGSVSSSADGTRSEGTVKFTIDKGADAAKVQGEIKWNEGRKQISGFAQVKFPENQFRELEIKVDIPYRNGEKWKLDVILPRGGREDEDQETNHYTVKISGETPLQPFTSFQADGSLELTSSFWSVKDLSLSGKIPSGSASTTNSWSLVEWKDFDVASNSNFYFLPLGSSEAQKNFLKFKLRNVIPSFETLSSLDSAIIFEVSDHRLGGSVLVEHETDSSVSVKLDAVGLPTSSHSAGFNLTYDEEFKKIQAHLVASHGPLNDKFKSSFHLFTEENSLDGEALLEWGNDDLSSLQSTFNYSLSGQDTKLNLHIFNPIRLAQSPDSEDANPVNIKLDASYNEPTGVATARLQAACCGEGKESTTELHAIIHNAANFESTINYTAPIPLFSNISSAGIRILTEIGGDEYKGAYGGHWGEDDASIDYKIIYGTQEDQVKRGGMLAVTLPLENFNSSTVEVFYFQDEAMNTEAKLRLEWNALKIVNCNYTQKPIYSADRKLQTITLDLDNYFWPLGIITDTAYNYTNQATVPTSLLHGLEIYDLTEPETIRLRGEYRIDRKANGKDFTISGIHPLRRVDLFTQYELIDRKLQHSTKLTWAPDAWMGYFLNAKDLSASGKMEHKGEIRIVYPEREIIVASHLEKRGRVIQLNTEIKPDSKRKMESIGLNLKLEEQGALSSQLTEKATLTIKHPTLKKDIRAEGEVRLEGKKSIDAKLRLDYSGKIEQALVLTWRLSLPLFNPQLRHWNFSSDARLQHPTTNLDLRALHTNQHSSKELSIITLIDYKNSEKLPDKSKITFELFKESRKLLIMMQSPQDLLNATAQLIQEDKQYSGIFQVDVKPKGQLCRAQVYLDMGKPYHNFQFNGGQEYALFSEGGIEDSRNLKYNLAESYDDYRFSDIDFYLRINHSRLLTSKLHWRPDLIQDFLDACRRRSDDFGELWNEQSEKFVHATSTEASAIVKKIWEDAKPSVEAFIEEMKSQFNFTRDADALRDFINVTVENNDFFTQNVTDFFQLMAQEASIRFSNIFQRLQDYRKKLLGDSSDAFEKTVVWVLEKLRDAYRQVLTAWFKYKKTASSATFSVAPVRDTLSSYFHQIWTTVSSGLGSVIDSLATLGGHVMGSMGDLVEKYKPNILSVAHDIEKYMYSLAVQISDYLYKTRTEVMSSPVYQKLADDIDQLYQDFTQQDAATNIRKYYAILRNKTLATLNKENHLDLFGESVIDLWNNFTQLEFVKDVKESWLMFQQKVTWLGEYLNIEETFQDFLVAIYMKGGDLVHQTVLEAGSRYEKAKTKFIFDPDKGIMEWEQKLPMPWKAFNETPAFQELPEYRSIKKLQNLFKSSQDSIWQELPDVHLYDSLQNLYPPFNGHAMIVGSSYLLTFDGLVYNFTGTSCALLLAGDMVDGNFSIALKYSEDGDAKPTSYSILVSVMRNTVAIDFKDNTLKTVKKGESSVLPLPAQLQFLQGYQKGTKLVVESSKGLLVSCDTNYHICTLEISGWYSRKVGGLLGTMDLEYTTDLIPANRKSGERRNLNGLIRSWEIPEESSPSCSIQPGSVFNLFKASARESRPSANCYKYFTYFLSPLQPCFSKINVDPFMGMCMDESLPSSSCSAAQAYINICKNVGINLEMPSNCIKCELNGEEMIDRDVRLMDSTTSSGRKQPSSDIVFIVEAKDCNKNFFAQKKLDLLMESLEEEMGKAGFISNRYALLVFGGSGVFEQAHPLMYNNQVFAHPPLTFTSNFNSINPGNGTENVFAALDSALKLDFRPGVSKTFILIPCSTCQPQHMTMDFSVIHHAMLEQDVTLHVLMNNDFSLENKSSGKKLFGLDSNFGFTKADAAQKPLRGETKLRQLARLPKKSLGHCIPLALQTNGSIFTAKKLQNKRSEAIKHFTTVFSRRVALSAKPAPCQTCYCSSNSEGVGRVRCFLCEYPRYQLTSDDTAVDSSSEEDETESKIPVVPTSKTPPLDTDSGESLEESDEYD